MKRPFLVLALLAGGCCPTGRIRDIGTPAAGADAVYLAAEARGCDLGNGSTTTWEPAPFPYPYDPTVYATGFCAWDGCGPRFRVVYQTSVCTTALGHELGHWCRRASSPDEATPNAYGMILYRDVGCSEAAVQVASFAWALEDLARGDAP